MAYALLPSYFGRDWWDTVDYPVSIVDQFFGDVLQERDLLPPSVFRGFLLRPRAQTSISASGRSVVKNDPSRFKISLNVSQFKQEELNVKIVDNFVVIHGKHEEKSDDHGLISREFTRRYVLPRNCDLEQVSSTLSPEGVLTITVPKKPSEEKPKEERQVPIATELQQTSSQTEAA